MQFELTEEFVQQIITLVENNEGKEVCRLLGELHPADVAEVLVQLSVEQTVQILRDFDDTRSSDVISELDLDLQLEILESYQPKEIADQFISNMESDDAVDIVAELDEEVREEVITHISDLDHASDIVDLLSYTEGSAGSLMDKEYIQVQHDWTFGECINEVRRQAQEIEDVYTVYVVDSVGKLLGTLSLKKLLVKPAEAKVSEFYNSDVKYAKATSSAEDVSRRMEKYDLIVLPVVDDLYRLIGRITIDDVVDFIKEEAEKDYKMASGITDDVDSNDSIWDLTKARIPWLLIGMVGGLLGAQVIHLFGVAEGGASQMALFIPLIAAMGGNVGVQSSAIIVQGLANNSLANTKIGTKLIKELGVALLNGAICSAVLMLYGYLFLRQMDASIAISLSLFTVVLVAAIFGTLIPLLLDKYKIDPALATGPFITTLNDVVGLAIYFTIGGWILG